MCNNSEMDYAISVLFFSCNNTMRDPEFQRTRRHRKKSGGSAKAEKTITEEVKREYRKCLKSATKRHSKGKLKLCPRGYCTAKHKFEVYPSAYANGYATQVCQGNKPDLESGKSADAGTLKRIKKLKRDSAPSRGSNLSRWYREKWVNVCEMDESGDFAPCGRSRAKLRAKDYPYCRPTYRMDQGTPMTVSEIVEKHGVEEIHRLCDQKRDMTPGVERKPTYLRTGKTERRRRRSRGRKKKSEKDKDTSPDMALVDSYNIVKPCIAKGRGGKTYYKPYLTDRGRHKLGVLVRDKNGRDKEVTFGHRDYQDYTRHRNKGRRSNYCRRSGGIKCRKNKDGICDQTSANFWSRTGLWNCDGVDACQSITDPICVRKLRCKR